MEVSVQVEELTSGASGRIRSIFSYNSLRKSLIFIQSIFLWFIFHLQRRRLSPSSPPPTPTNSTSSAGKSKRKFVFRRDEEDTLRRRALAEGLQMVTDERSSYCQWSASLFFGTRRNALFCRSWFPVNGEIRGIMIIIHGLNEHSGRYAHFARQLNSCNFRVYAMDWIGHGGSDGLHGYVPSLDHVVADTGAFLEKVKSENPGIPCFLFGHSTGGAVVLKFSGSSPPSLSISSDSLSTARLLDNEIRILKEELQRTNLELDSFKENIEENQEKIKLNKQLPYLVGNIVECFKNGRYPRIGGQAA